jgi:excisionase family DNA binding protein
MAETPSPWLTKAEAGELMRVSPRTIDAWAEAGRITRHRVAGLQSVRFARAELEALLVPEEPS